MTQSWQNRFPEQPISSLTQEKVRHDLAESVGPDLLLSDVLGANGIDDLASLKLEYGTAAGARELREAIAIRHAVNADDVVVTIGAMHAIFLLGSVLCNPDDHVLVAEPVFPMTNGAIAFNGARIEALGSYFEDAYRLDTDAFISRLTAKTRLVCLTSPQNPSGVALSTQAVSRLLQAMTNVCPDAFVLVDETYREASYADEAVQSSFLHLDERIISCASLSKCHGAPGLRIGWLISTNGDLIAQMTRAKFQTIIACSGVDEALALKILNNSNEILASRRQLLDVGRDRIATWVEENQDLIEWIKPDAGALCCVALKQDRYSARAVSAFYEQLRHHSVRVAPGVWFKEHARVFRVGFGLLPIPELQQALEVVTHVLKSTCDKN